MIKKTTKQNLTQFYMIQHPMMITHINVVLQTFPRIFKTTISVDSQNVFVWLVGQILLWSFGG